MMDFDSDTAILAASVLGQDGNVSLVLPDGHVLKTSAEALSTFAGKLSWTAAVRETWQSRQNDEMEKKKRAKLYPELDTVVASVPRASPAKEVDSTDPLVHAEAELAKYNAICDNLKNEIAASTASLELNTKIANKWQKIVTTLKEEE